MAAVLCGPDKFRTTPKSIYLDANFKFEFQNVLVLPPVVAPFYLSYCQLVSHSRAGHGPSAGRCANVHTRRSMAVEPGGSRSLTLGSPISKILS